MECLVCGAKLVEYHAYFKIFYRCPKCSECFSSWFDHTYLHQVDLHAELCTYVPSEFHSIVMEGLELVSRETTI